MNVSVDICQCQLGDITAFAMIQSLVTAVAKIPSCHLHDVLIMLAKGMVNYLVVLYAFFILKLILVCLNLVA